MDSLKLISLLGGLILWMAFIVSFFQMKIQIKKQTEILKEQKKIICPT